MRKAHGEGRLRAAQRGPDMHKVQMVALLFEAHTVPEQPSVRTAARQCGGRTEALPRLDHMAGLPCELPTMGAPVPSLCDPGRLTPTMALWLQA